MPVPKPRRGENKNKFISRCISTLSHEDPNRDPKQVQAICHTAWEQGKGEEKEVEVKEKKVIKRKVIAENLPIIFSAEMVPGVTEDE